MSNGEQIKVELEALSELRYQLQILQEKLNDTIMKAQYAVREETNRLSSIREQKEKDIENCRTALDRCRALVDDEGRRPPCYTEMAALQRAQDALVAIQSHITSFQSQAEQNLNQLNRYRESVSTKVEDARKYLQIHIEQTLRYLKENDVAIPGTPGRDAHGSDYQRARRRWYREARDFENEPSHLRGWMRQEVNAGGYYSSPDGYDVGHFIRNLNIPENFRWEAAEMNRGRAARVMQHFPHINNF